MSDAAALEHASARSETAEQISSTWRWPRALAWLPIPAFLIVLAGLWFRGLHQSYESPYLLLGLNLLFSTLVSLVIAYLVGLSFINRGAPGLLLLCGGVVAWGAVSSIAVLAGVLKTSSEPLDPNTLVTIHNTGVWLSSALHLAGVVVSIRTQGTVGATRLRLAVMLVVVVGLVALITALAAADLLPPFFVQKQGGTLVRQVVLGSAIAMFTLTAALLWKANGSSRSAFSYWYALALLLLAVGLLGVLSQASVGSLVGWTGRLAQFLGGVYMFIAALASARDSGLGGVKLDQMLREARYRYSFAVTVVVAAAALRMVFLQGLDTRSAFITLFPAITVAALYGGLRPGLLASMLSAAIAGHFWVEPANRFSPDWLSLGVFLGSGIMISLIIDAMQRAQARAAKAEADIALASERQRAADAVRQSEDRLRVALARADITVFTQDRDLRYTWCHHPHEHFAGGCLLGKTDEELVPQDAERLRAIKQPVLDTGIGAQQEVQMHFGDQICTYDLIVEPVRDSDGPIVGIICSAANITERKHAEEALLRSQEQFRSVLENSLDAVYRRDLRTDTYDYLSPVIEQVMGISPERMQAMPIHAFIDRTHPEDREQVRDAVQRGMQAGKGLVEYRFRTDEGHYRWLADHFSVQTDACGRPLFRSGIVRDVTAQKEAEEALRASEKQYRRIVETADEGVWILDHDNRTVYANAKLVAMLGYTLDEMHGRALFDFVGPEARQEAEQNIQRRRQGIAEQHEFKFIRKDGTELWALVCTNPIHDDAGQYAGALGMLTDITERKRAEAERKSLMEAERAARSEAEKALRLKDEFLATVSHELRNPLNALMGWTRLLAKGSVDVPKAVDIIGRSASTLSQIVADLLDMSRIVSGKIQLELESTDLVGLVGNVLDAVRVAAEAKKISVSTCFDPELRPILCDPNRVQQIIHNLLSNAVKFTPEGGLISVSVVRQPGRVQITVQDNGQGIPEEFLPHVFERFRQADQSVNRRHGGLGLGLSIVKHLVELHGGTARAESQGEGRGATFTFSLPSRSSYAQPEPFGRLPIRPIVDEVTEVDLRILRNRSVLIVDDDLDNCTLVARILEEVGAVTRTTTSALEGLKLIADCRPDLVISDIGMPEMNGYEFVRQIRAMGDGHSLLPCLALTAFARPEDREVCLRAGFDEYLSKPLSIVQLAQALGRIASMARPV